MKDLDMKTHKHFCRVLQRTQCWSASEVHSACPEKTSYTRKYCTKVWFWRMYHV